MPPFTAFAHALNWISQLLCSAADSFTNVFPFTSKGLVESPELVTGGAAMPPSAALVLADTVVEAVPEADAVAVEFENVATVDDATVEAEDVEVSAAASTVTVPVTMEQTDDETAFPTTATGVVAGGRVAAEEACDTTLAITALALAEAIVEVEIAEPMVADAVTGRT